MLQIGNLEFDYIAHPPRSPVNRSLSRRVKIEGAFSTQLAIYEFPKAAGFLHVFQTERQIGHLSYNEKAYLERLEESGEPFIVYTDLLSYDGRVENFEGVFDPEQKPVYVCPIVDGSFWTYTIPLYLIP